MIVDNDKQLSKLIKIYLNTCGYEVITAVDNQDVLDSVEALNPDLLLLEIMPPAIDGLTICRQIKTNKSTSHLPVIFFTEKRGTEDIKKGKQAGADWYITKPFKSAHLVECIKNHLS